MEILWDVFICHASEDKDEVARPLAEALEKKGLRVWYDEYSLKLGDSLRRSIDRGLSKSKYGIVILSPNFFKKEWPQKELDGLAAREVGGKTVILPIWHNLTKEEVAKYSPMLADRVAGKTRDGVNHIVDQIMRVFEEPEIILQAKEKIVRITVNKDALTIGSSLKVTGTCINCGNRVHLVVSGPGEYSKGREIATPVVSHANTWEYEWSPGLSILPGVYTLTAFGNDPNVSDEVFITAFKGSITITYEGSGSYYIGEKIRFLGTSTAGKTVYLSIKGPNAIQDEKNLQMTISVKNGDPTTFLKVDVRGDNTWSYVWDTSNVATILKPGFYRIYVIEGPYSTDNLTDKIYSMAIINFKLPFVTAAISKTTIVKGDNLKIFGTAEGVDNLALQIWIFGTSIASVKKIFRNPDRSYSYEIPRFITKTFDTGQFFIVIQHPMMNNEFDIYVDEKTHVVLSNYPTKGTPLFALSTDGTIQGFDVMNILIEALNDQNNDDTYTILSFLVESPMIRFDPITDKSPGDTFRVTAITNLSIGDQVNFQIYPSSVDPDKITKSSQFPFASGIVTVMDGKTGEWNLISFDVDASFFKPDEYAIKVSALDIDITVYTFFNVISKA